MPLMKRGEDAHNSKLRDVEVSIIREQLALGYRQALIASFYGVSPQTISAINMRVGRYRS